MRVAKTGAPEGDFTRCATMHLPSWHIHDTCRIVQAFWQDYTSSAASLVSTQQVPTEFLTVNDCFQLIIMAGAAAAAAAAAAPWYDPVRIVFINSVEPLEMTNLELAASHL
jgi:hypothetical protein